ncbi:MAG: (2Fe-2S)-binding protein [Bacteroidales bacterium]
MERNEIICSCMDITKGEVEDAIKDKKLTSVSQVQDETEAGTVCGACVDDIYLLLEEMNGKVD